jgi:ferredoxin-NADP reductase
MKGIIIKITDEAKDIMGFRIKLDNSFSYTPGQYVMLSFPNLPDIKKAFSIASYNKMEKEIFLVIKKHGEFTTRLFGCKEGEELTVYGPFGRFILPVSSETQRPVVFIAGGIGITPLFNMLHHIHDSSYNHNAYLFYSAKKKEEMALTYEIDSIHDKRIKVTYNYTESGKRLDIDDIKHHVPEFEECIFYICGPLPMIESFRESLKTSNILEERIKSEEFN